LFQAAAIVIAIGAMFPQRLMWFILVPVLGVTVFLIVYSWREYEKEIGSSH
jgi:uncharacterized membrane protein